MLTPISRLLRETTRPLGVRHCRDRGSTSFPSKDNAHRSGMQLPRSHLLSDGEAKHASDGLLLDYARLAPCLHCPSGLTSVGLAMLTTCASSRRLDDNSDVRRH